VSDKNKTNVFRVYAGTLQLVKDHIGNIPGATIIRFIDEAIKEKLQKIANEQKT
jgi:hypothetical protein